MRFLRHVALLTTLAAPAAALQDPFSAGERWLATPGTGADWTPEDVALAGDGAFVWSGLRGGDHVLLLHDTVASGSQAPRGVVTRGASEATVPSVAAGTRGDRVFALRQEPAPGSTFRRIPSIHAYDPIGASAGQEMVPAWTHGMGLEINGATRLAADATGDLVVAAVWDDSRAVTRVDILSGEDGSLLGRTEVPAIGLSALDVSADGQRIAMVCGLSLHVVDRSGAVVHTEGLTSSTSAIAMSENGSVIAYGQIGSLRTLSDSFGLGYAAGLQLPAQGTELPSRLDLSSDGTMIAVAWWNYVDGMGVRLEIFDTIFGFPLASYSVPGFFATQQDLPTDVRITPDGRRAAMGSWGNGSEPELVVLDAGGFFPALTIDLPGSVRAMDMDASGTRFAVGHKDVHAQTFGSAGAVRFVDSGERSIQATDTPRLGGALELAARYQGANSGFFLSGVPAAPQTFPGVTGQLLLNRQSLQVIPAAVDANGRMDLSLPIGVNPSLVGVRFHVQAAFRVPGSLALTDDLATPFILN